MPFKFCSECNNLLYPKEDKQNRVLNYACRNCDYSEDAEVFKVYTNEIIASQQSTMVAVDVSDDPTFPRTNKTCPKCGHNEAAYFQSNKGDESSMKLFFACCSPVCDHRWVD